MPKILGKFKQALSKTILSFALLVLVSCSTLFSFQQPSYAVPTRAYNLTPEEKIDRAYNYSEATGLNEEKRQEAYEQAVKDAQSPQTVEKAYERNLKAEKAENPEPNLLEKAEQVVEKVLDK